MKQILNNNKDSGLFFADFPRSQRDRARGSLCTRVRGVSVICQTSIVRKSQVVYDRASGRALLLLLLLRLLLLLLLVLLLLLKHRRLAKTWVPHKARTRRKHSGKHRRHRPLVWCKSHWRAGEMLWWVRWVRRLR